MSWSCVYFSLWLMLPQIDTSRFVLVIYIALTVDSVETFCLAQVNAAYIRHLKGL